MKKSLPVISFISAIILINGTLVYADDHPEDILTPESLLINSSDYSSVKEISADIRDMADSFEQESFSADQSDILFDNAYKVYVDADILNNQPRNLHELSELLNQSDTVWNIPLSSNNKTVVVQVSKAPELNEIDQSQMSQDEITEAAEKAGKWQAVASTLYDKTSDSDDIINSLSALNDIDQQHEVILIGGEPGIQSVMALITENDSITGAVSLQRDISFVPDDKSSEITLEQNKLYTLDKFEEASRSLVQAADNLSDSTGGESSSQSKSAAAFRYIVYGVLIIGSVAAGILIYKRNKNEVDI